MKKNNNTIVFVAGHSGGHIIPCATQAKKEKDKSNYNILFITTNNSLDKKIINNFNFIDKKIYLSIVNVTKNPLKLFKSFWFLTTAFFKSFFLLKKDKPLKIVSMGGLISIPVCLAAKLLRIPIELWELNIEPGKTVKFLSSFVSTVNICFQETEKYFPKKISKVVGYPIRFKIESKKISKNSIIKKIGFSITKKTILIIGGSQGSHFINNLFKEFILKNLIYINKHIQIIHQTGNSEFDWNLFYKSHNICAITFNFHDKIDEYYVISDLIICRSGAGTLAEIQFFEKKCITIPLETKTTNHQILNANYLAKNYPYFFKVIKQEEKFEVFERQIKNFINL